MNTLELIKQKPICFYGLGRENLALIRYLSNKKLLSEVVYADQSSTALKLPLPSRQVSPEEMLDYQVIFKAPGVSLYQDILQLAISRGITVLSPNQLFFDLNPAFKICVTGSKGKSTFCKLLMEMLKAIGANVVAAGNIGVPLMDLMEEKFDVAVIELSSYQLASLNITPDIAVITSLFPEHLSWHLSLDRYYQDKLRITQNGSGLFLINQQTATFLDNFAPQISYQLINYSIDNRIVSLDHGASLQINNSYFYPQHLQATLQGAVGVFAEYAKRKSLRFEELLPLIQEAVDCFRGLSHRLELFYERDGIIAVDDSISTAPEATIAALESYKQYPVSLFVGGYSKGTSQKVLIDYLNAHPEIRPYCYSVTGRIIFDGLTNPHKYYAETLTEVISCARDRVATGEGERAKHLFLLSPGAASFDQYRDFEDRGQQFKNYFLK